MLLFPGGRGPSLCHTTLVVNPLDVSSSKVEKVPIVTLFFFLILLLLLDRLEDLPGELVPLATTPLGIVELTPFIELLQRVLEYKRWSSHVGVFRTISLILEAKEFWRLLLSYSPMA